MLIFFQIFVPSFFNYMVSLKKTRSKYVIYLKGFLFPFCQGLHLRHQPSGWPEGKHFSSFQPCSVDG